MIELLDDGRQVKGKPEDGPKNGPKGWPKGALKGGSKGRLERAGQRVGPRDHLGRNQDKIGKIEMGG